MDATIWKQEKPWICRGLHEQENREPSTQKIWSNDSTSKTNSFNLISFIILEDSILEANFFSNVEHNIEFQLLDTFLISADFTINLLQIKSNMDVIGSCRFSKIHELKLSATMKDTQSYLCPGKYLPSVQEAHWLRIWSLVGFQVWQNHRTLKLLVGWCINKLFKDEWMSMIHTGYSCCQVKLQNPITIRMIRIWNGSWN